MHPSLRGCNAYQRGEGGGWGGGGWAGYSNRTPAYPITGPAPSTSNSPAFMGLIHDERSGPEPGSSKLHRRHNRDGPLGILEPSRGPRAGTLQLGAILSSKSGMTFGGGEGGSPSPWDEAQCLVPDRSDDCAAMTFLRDSCDENLRLTCRRSMTGRDRKRKHVSQSDDMRGGKYAVRASLGNGTTAWYGFGENEALGVLLRVTLRPSLCASHRPFGREDLVFTEANQGASVLRREGRSVEKNTPTYANVRTVHAIGSGAHFGGWVGPQASYMQT